MITATPFAHYYFLRIQPNHYLPNDAVFLHWLSHD
ncbi:hypothetical protein Pla144_48490 [Bythopirellula polymerisocia]|uniref:Uncharacterized protein n=1 Tax=Bythopirellula polymerisocia TaxID=2528003 RepID=A0A5C6CA31_9BACT|nr:hypothetical protein Pla144_48490 [Bythopirellula polymerisocia]